LAEHLKPWAALTPTEAVEVLAETMVPWWIVGGWTIDLFVGRQTRQHDDLDVVFLRCDQIAAQGILAGWDLWAADPPGTLRPWEPGEFLGPRIHDIWCRREPSAPWSLQIMLAESADDRWVFRRDPRVTAPLAQLGRETGEGTPYLAPHVQLLFKSGTGRRPKDEADFAMALPLLDPLGRRWLAEALNTTSPGHPWLARLAGVISG